MSIAAELLQRHIQTLVDDHQQWQRLIADNIVWELAYAPAIGHPAKLSGRDEVLHHVRWFLGAVENFRFIDPKVYAFVDPPAAFTAKSKSCSSVPLAIRSHTFGNILTQHGRPNRWMRRFSILNRGSKLRRFGGQITTRR